MDDQDFPAEDDDSLLETFKRATEFVTYNASVMNQEDLLYLYGRYKQANVGPCAEPMPGILKFQKRSKWSAWNSLGDMTKEDAMKQYIDKVSKINSEWDTKKPKDASSKKFFGPVTSTCLNTDPEIKEESKTVFDFVKEGNLEKLQEFINSDDSLKNAIDDESLSLLHWACDRGQNEIVNYLISKGTNLNSQDSDGQTALHYASSCGHEHAVKLLLEAGAKADIQDSDGLSPADVAYNTSLKQLFSKDS